MHHHHHHHVLPQAKISLTLPPHSSLSSIAFGRLDIKIHLHMPSNIQTNTANHSIV